MKVGILGAGQLARMLAEAGLPAGLEFVFVDPNPDSCAAALGLHIQAEWDAPEALEALGACDRVTCDFENVPASVLDALAASVTVRPSARALAAAQDRLLEKQRFARLGLATPACAAVDSRLELVDAVERIGLPAVLKTRRMGYDGKGQMLLRDHEDIELAWQKLGGVALILEQWIAFDHECAVTAVRAANGDFRCWPLTHTWHEQGILRLAWAPAPAADRLQQQASLMIRKLAENLDYVGSLTLELFVVGDRLLANEFAPRVHNSAHWTIEGSYCSQFENHLRALCDWPLGSTDARGSALMVNFIGQVPRREQWLAVPGLSWHDYGKSARPGRKVGHATLSAANAAELKKHAAALRGLLDAGSVQALASIAAD
ncbi:MAG: 5-(carboxyamino)imidazole ribonucleotide synthase [Wenzhouxiangellaceae bacterium]|nr:5-(carboxyamino)imidazole ribonucleotide synthase [Wenzhouxiangellaceae bacterium]